jgi:hypothetical protein
MTWLSLDAGDNDPTRFWAYVIAALQQVQAGLGETAGTMLRASPPQSPPLEATLTVLINEISASPTPLVLVLDDYHVIEAPAIHDALAFLLDHAPPPLHLVIATRADPPLPLSRLRGRDQLTELRTADLRFTPDEAASFLNQVMGLGLTPEDVAALEARTEGLLVAGSPSHRLPCAETTGSLQFPRYPHAPMPCSQTPVVSPAPRPNGDGAVAFHGLQRVGFPALVHRAVTLVSTSIHISRLNRTAWWLVPPGFAHPITGMHAGFPTDRLARR